MTDTEPATDPRVRVELDPGGVLRVTLNRPGKRNALDNPSWEALGTAFGERARQDDVRCVVLRGAGSSFCAGLDRAVLFNLGSGGGSGDDIRTHGPLLQAVVDSIAECPRPTLAVVSGACLGAGMALLLACDLRIAAADAFFSMMEMRYAFVPDLGHVHRLQREVGAARTREILYVGERFDAERLVAWGVLNQVVPPAELDLAAVRWEERLRQAPPLAVRAVKRLLQDHPGGVDGAASQRDALAANAGGLIGGEDFREGVAASIEGRQPDFRGRS